jgi:hypothetical protein
VRGRDQSPPLRAHFVLTASEKLVLGTVLGTRKLKGGNYKKFTVATTVATLCCVQHKVPYLCPAQLVSCFYSEAVHLEDLQHSAPPPPKSRLQIVWVSEYLSLDHCPDKSIQSWVSTLHLAKWPASHRDLCCVNCNALTTDCGAICGNPPSSHAYKINIAVVSRPLQLTNQNAHKLDHHIIQIMYRILLWHIATETQ